jgi:Ion channel
MIKKIHQQTRSLLFKNNREDWPYLVQVVFLFLLVGFPIYGGSVISHEVIAFSILFIIFIFYGIILLEEPNILLLISGIGSIIILLFKATGQEIESDWIQRIELILPIIYFALLGLRLVGDTLAEKVSMKLIYISIANYFTIGILFNFVFQLIHITDIHAFNFSSEIKYNYLYMSFVILSSVGLGDLLPVSAAAKSAVVMESIAGQLYLTFFVAIIIGKYLAEYSQNKTGKN